MNEKQRFLADEEERPSEAPQHDGVVNIAEFLAMDYSADKKRDLARWRRQRGRCGRHAQQA